MKESALNNNKNDNKRLCGRIIDMARKVYRENGGHDIVFVSSGKEKDGANEETMDRLVLKKSKGPDQQSDGRD